MSRRQAYIAAGISQRCQYHVIVGAAHRCVGRQGQDGITRRRDIGGLVCAAMSARCLDHGRVDESIDRAETG